MRFSPSQLNRKSSEPLYIQVFHILRQAVGETAPDSGTVLPSTTELAHQFKVSQNTVRAAMRMLVESRLVCRIRHRGTVPVSCMRPEDPQADNRSIGLVFPMSGYDFWQPVLKIMHEAADIKGFSLDIYLYNGNGNELQDEQRALQQALRNCSGIILYGDFRGADRELIEQFNRERPPLVLFLLYHENMDVSIVASDGYSAIAEMTEKLLHKGCRRPLFCYRFLNNTNQVRLAGFKDALQRSGLSFKPEMTCSIDLPDRELREKIARLKPDALICSEYTDAMIVRGIPPENIVIFAARHDQDYQNNGINLVVSPTDLLGQAAIDEVVRRIYEPKAYRRKVLVRMENEIFNLKTYSERSKN
ncbi:MAG: GntR family transcriptional regulator [Lentisphaeria bacterium]|nr:GntR family transcriptional regulator [Lentisphaeria bacterium]